MTPIRSLDVDRLRWHCDDEDLGFDTTDELQDKPRIVGQPRAEEALRFGMEMEQEGYNLFALGPPGRGKRSLVCRMFEESAEKKERPPDLCYVHNFEEAHRPRAIELPAGRGRELREDMKKLVEELRTALSAAFESEEFQARQQELEQSLQEQQEEVFEEVREKARERGLALVRTPGGLVFAPAGENGQPLQSDELERLTEEERERLRSAASDLQNELQRSLRQVPSWQREAREKLRDLNREFADLAVGGLFRELREKYEEFPPVVEHLERVQEDIIENFRSILGQDSEGPAAMMQALSGQGRPAGGDAVLDRYRVNLLVDHADSKGAPALFEDHPTFANLIGRVEHKARMGALTTDFNLIKPGALHRANGGYLLLEARKLLQQPFSWEVLKRVLRSGEIRIESPAEAFSLISTVTLEPQPIPVRLKVALLGEPLLYYLLSAYDPEFQRLFKVKVDFAERMDRQEENLGLYARMIAGMVEHFDLRPFHRTAVARVLEESARMAGDAERLSTEVQGVADLLREADYWARRRESGVVEGQDVQQAIDAQIFRSDRMRERAYEEIHRGTHLIDTDGEVVGQINGLSVLQLGDFAFGRPSRITASLRLGDGKVVDIEREVKLGGPIHSKGVLILTGFLGSRFGKQLPLSLAASLVFEQSYGSIDGDSASSAELYALLSAIAEVPLRQDLAVTGSVNQQGRIQAIGGANEKIEGFFDICKERGLTGKQGVLIPESNAQHLMLRHDVLEAVREKKFQIFAVETVEEGIEILTGVPAGEPDEKGEYPEGTVFARAKGRLEEMAQQRLKLLRAAKEGDS